MKRRKNGFTLIELLVAIAIMISVTVIAVISITKVSEQNKKQAYELVKDQVKTAALEFFSANEYLFEGLVNAEGKITVKRLVEEGYLNSLTNPVTGKKLNGCDYIEVSKSNGKYNYNFKTDNNSICSENSYIITKEAEDPEVSVYKACNTEGNIPWCIDTETVTLSVGKGNISEAQYVLNNGETRFMTFDNDNKTYYFKDNCNSPDSSGTKFHISVPGTRIGIDDKYYIDNTVPNVKFISKIYGEDNYSIELNDGEKKILIGEETEVLKKLNYKLKDNDLTTKKEGNLAELANYDGNWTNKDVVVVPYIDATKVPSGIKTFRCYFENKGTNETLDEGDSLFTRKNLDTTLHCDAITVAGNTSSAGTNLKVDEIPPTCEITESGKNTIASSYDSSTSKTFKLKTDDNLSGISKSVISNSNIGDLSNYSNNDNLNLTIGSNNFALYGKVRDNAGNENTCNTGTIAVNTYSDCELVVVADHKTEMVNDWYNIATGQPKIISYVNGSPVKEVDASEGSYSYSFPSGYNCKSTPSSVTVKYDKTPPEIIYVKTAGEISTDSNAAAKWTNDSTKYDVKTYDTLSGINTNANFGGTSGIYYVTWNKNSNTSLTNSTVISSNHDDISQTTINGFTAYVRKNGSLASTGKRKQIYKSCDLAGNCKEAPVYVNSCYSFATLSKIEDITKFVNVVLSVSNLDSSKKTIAAAGKAGTESNFTFESKISGLTIHEDISGAYCGNSSTCATVENHKGWNVSKYVNKIDKSTWCATEHSCKSGWNYVTACAKISCGNNTAVKKICYRRTLNGTGGFSYVGAP